MRLVNILQITGAHVTVQLSIKQLMVIFLHAELLINCMKNRVNSENLLSRTLISLKAYVFSIQSSVFYYTLCKSVLALSFIFIHFTVIFSPYVCKYSSEINQWTCITKQPMKNPEKQEGWEISTKTQISGDYQKQKVKMVTTCEETSLLRSSLENN